jgi:RNA-directed DNA polymerase
MNIYSINNLAQLANFLRCDEIFLTAYLQGDFKILDRGDNFTLPTSTGYTSIIEKLYLRKKNKRLKSYREVYSVRTDTLKNVLKGLSTFLNESHIPSAAVHGYVHGKNIRTNAERHLAKRYLLSVDLSNFFGSITADMVSKALLSIGFSNFAVQHLSKIVTINNFLPPGYSTSPVISNIVVKTMDEALLQLCGADCVYTRYADDLYFSSNIALPTLENISKIVGDYGFVLNPQKTKYMPRGVKQYVTGLTVFDHIRPRVTKKIKRNLRLELYYLLAYGLRGHVLQQMGKTIADYEKDDNIKSEVDGVVKSIDNRITGWLRFMYSVESVAAQKLIDEYKKVSQ